MAEETQYTANTGWCAISTPNSSLTGGGTLGTLLTGASKGTLVKSIMFKAITDTGEGMLRLFVDDNSGTVNLIKEIPVPAITKAGINPAFETRINMDFVLQNGYLLKVSTELGDTFNVIAEGLDWDYYDNGVRMDTTQYTVNTGTNPISTANSSLNGTGSTTVVYASGSSATYKGSSVSSIVIKCYDNTSSPGMVRLYLNDGVSTTRLFTEIMVSSEVHDGTDQSFEKTVVFENDLDIKAGWQIYASTENTQNFWIVVEGRDWKYQS